MTATKKQLENLAKARKARKAKALKGVVKKTTLKLPKVKYVIMGKNPDYDKTQKEFVLAMFNKKDTAEFMLKNVKKEYHSDYKYWIKPV